ncbi:MAG: LysR family transcriptional regulator [Myxococcota bacterium]|nr:LysR family transcriptional regulator [Myxococcota bacterium]
MERSALVWDDLRILLAVARAGSNKRAAKALRVDPATVSRRIGALEAALAQKLFRVNKGRRVPTDAGARLVAMAERLDAELLAAHRELGESAARPQGVVRVSTVDVIAAHVLAPAIGAMRAEHPGLVLELLATPTVLDLARGDADVAIRLTEPTEEGLKRKRLARLELAVFAHRALLERVGIDAAAPGDGEGLPLVEYGAALTAVPETDSVRAILPRADIVLRTTSVGSVLGAVEHGQAAGVLPVSFARRVPDLARLQTPALPARDVWLAVHPDAARVPRIRAACELIELAFAQLG